MVKHCPQLSSTWPRSVPSWKVNLTYSPVICQYLTLIWQKKKGFGTASAARRGVCAASCLHFFGPSAISDNLIVFAYVRSRKAFRNGRRVVTIICKQKRRNSSRRNTSQPAGLRVALAVCTEHIHKPHIGIVNYLHKEWYKNYLSIYQHYDAPTCEMCNVVDSDSSEHGDGW